ncbi:hypothetical protein TrCOL_g13109 [Triparma columacea]|uniref:O-fucosyltransferase family protein n=1 Tax=Triparma columacea TaxID=722753 RepID=A0A9W7L736_9STRA|nr:hypothetical protein TrCOL_g13109 [Triparma columacea]
MLSSSVFKKLAWATVAITSFLALVHQQGFSISTTIPLFSKTKTNETSFVGSNFAREEQFLPLGARDVDVLPKWIQEYIVFHEKEKKRSKEGDASVKFLVMSCVSKACHGGTVDRLTPVPFFVLLAALSGRVLLIHWTIPSELENFLVPPTGGIDWTKPPHVDLGAATNPSTRNWMNEATPRTLEDILNKYNKSQVLNLSFGAGSTQFMKMEQLLADHTKQELKYGEESQEDWTAIFPTLFSKVFTPSPRLAEFMVKEITNLGLVRGNFLAVHGRVHYPFRKDGKPQYPTVEEESQILRNAIDCAINIREKESDANIYVACDRIHVAESIKDEYESEFPGLVKVDEGVNEDQHIAFSTFNDGAHEDVVVEPFLPTFSDLWIMGMARCVVHGVGGYGSFSAMLAGNRCTYSHRRGEKRFWTAEHTQCPNK